MGCRLCFLTLTASIGLGGVAYAAPIEPGSAYENVARNRFVVCRTDTEGRRALAKILSGDLDSQMIAEPPRLMIRDDAGTFACMFMIPIRFVVQSVSSYRAVVHTHGHTIHARVNQVDHLDDAIGSFFLIFAEQADEPA